jgi:hypothetical protein
MLSFWQRGGKTRFVLIFCNFFVKKKVRNINVKLLKLDRLENQGRQKNKFLFFFNLTFALTPQLRGKKSRLPGIYRKYYGFDFTTR